MHIICAECFVKMEGSGSEEGTVEVVDYFEELVESGFRHSLDTLTVPEDASVTVDDTITVEDPYKEHLRSFNEITYSVSDAGSSAQPASRTKRCLSSSPSTVSKLFVIIEPFEPWT